MSDLMRLKRRFVSIVAVLGSLSLALLAYWLWPTARGPQLDVLQQEHKSLSREVSVRRSSNPDATRQALKEFAADNIPTRSSEIDQHIEKLIQTTGVTRSAIRYADAPDRTAISDVQQVTIDTTVTGDYAKVASFINAMEKDKLLFIIDKISLSSHEGGTVSLQITFSTFLKTA